VKESQDDDKASKKSKKDEESPEEDEEEVLYKRFWSPIFYQMIGKTLFRWIILPLFVSFVQLTTVIFLCVYPVLVLPG
jgi:hypothetical protein